MASDSWRDSYDAWKLASPPEYDSPDEPEDMPTRFAEDERPIPELPGSFEILVDSIDEIRVGPFELQSCGEHRLTCRWEGSRIVIDRIEVKVSRHVWANADDYSSESVRCIAHLIRRHYAWSGGQKLLKLECEAQDEEAGEYGI